MCAGISHITGGGFFENIPRCLPKGVSASIQKSSYSVPKIFRLIAGDGRHLRARYVQHLQHGDRDVHRGSAGRSEQGADAAGKEGELVWKIGEVISGGEGVELW